MRECSLCGKTYGMERAISAEIDNFEVPAFMANKKNITFAKEHICPECREKYATLHTVLKTK